MRRFVLTLLCFLPLSAFAGNSCNESVAAATLSEDGQTLYLGLTRGAVHQVNLETLEVKVLLNPAGTYYNCIHDLRLIHGGEALFAFTSADLGIHFNLRTGAKRGMPYSEAWGFDIQRVGLDSSDDLWIEGVQPNLRPRVICHIGAEFRCSESDQNIPETQAIDKAGGTVSSYAMTAETPITLVTANYEAALRVDGQLTVRQQGVQKSYAIPRSDGETYIGYIGEIEGPAPFASLSVGSDAILLLGETLGVVHLVDLTQQRRRTLSCGSGYEPRRVCAVIYNGPL